MARSVVSRSVFHLWWLVILLVPAACAPLQNDVAHLAGDSSAKTVSTPESETEDESVVITPVKSEAIMRYEELVLSDGTTIEYVVVLPPNFDATKEYPILLAMPPGLQTRSMVDAGLDGFWAAGAIENGWIVLSPVAPNGQLYFRGSEAHIPEFLMTTAQQYRPEGGRVHIGGISNGGISAFRIAGQNSELFHSLLVLPGFPQTAEDKANLDALAAMPVAMFVGGNDTNWIAPMQAAAGRLANQGADVLFEVVPDEGHLITSLSGGERLYELLESYR